MLPKTASPEQLPLVEQVSLRHIIVDRAASHVPFDAFLIVEISVPVIWLAQGYVTRVGINPFALSRMSCVVDTTTVFHKHIVPRHCGRGSQTLQQE